MTESWGRHFAHEHRTNYFTAVRRGDWKVVYHLHPIGCVRQVTLPSDTVGIFCERPRQHLDRNVTTQIGVRRPIPFAHAFLAELGGHDIGEGVHDRNKLPLQQLHRPDVALVARDGEVEPPAVGRELAPRGTARRVVEADAQPGAFARPARLTHPRPEVTIGARVAVLRWGQDRVRAGTLTCAPTGPQRTRGFR